MLFGPLRIDESTKSNTFDFSVTRKVIGKRVLKPVDSLVDVVRTTISTVLIQKFQKILLFYIVSFFQKSLQFGFWYPNSSNHF